MILSDKEFKDYIEAHLDFLYYVGKRTGLLSKSMNFMALIPGTPKIVKATILPLQDKINYDGFMEPYRIRPGKVYKNELNMLYKNAKAKKELITEID